VIIPWKELDAEILTNVIEAFVLREGTDYGEQERTLAGEEGFPPGQR